MQDEGMESAPRTQAAPEPLPPPEAAPGHRLPWIWMGTELEIEGMNMKMQLSKSLVDFFCVGEVP